MRFILSMYTLKVSNWVPENWIKTRYFTRYYLGVGKAYNQTQI